MQRRGWLIAGWATATVLAVALGLQGVKAVSSSVTGARRAPLSQAGVHAALDRAPAVDATPPPASSSDVGTTTASSAAVPGDNGVASSSAFSNPQPNSGSPDDDDGSGSDSSAGIGAPQDQTFQVAGGTVSVRYENGEAHLLWASPASGFEIENHSGGSDVDVRFRSDDHESRVRAFWNDGPQHEIEEKDD